MKHSTSNNIITYTDYYILHQVALTECSISVCKQLGNSNLGIIPWLYLPAFFSMMTPSNGNIFRVTGLLCREFTGEFPTQRPVMWSFDVFFDLHLNKRLSKQSRRRWLLWRHCNEYIVVFFLRICHQPSLTSHLTASITEGFNSSPPRQNGCHCADNILICISVNEKFCILIKISLRFVPKIPIDNKPALVWIMAWPRLGDKS